MARLYPDRKIRRINMRLDNHVKSHYPFLEIRFNYCKRLQIAQIQPVNIYDSSAIFCLRRRIHSFNSCSSPLSMGGF